MKEVGVAGRYAKAFFEIASERKLESEFQNNLKLVVDTLETNSKLMTLLLVPTIDVTKKKKIITETFTNLHPLTQNLLFILLDRHRVEQLPEIHAQFYQLVLEARGEARATVTSAFPLTEADEQQLINIFTKVVNKKILISKQVDPELLGGVIVQIDDRVYDGSLRTKLKRFQEKLQHA